jgi:hypothetical protein
VNIGYTAAAKMFSSTTRVCPSAANGQVSSRKSSSSSTRVIFDTA